MMLFGWTLPQFAEAGAWFSSTEGYLPIPDLAGAVLVMERWRSNKEYDPSGPIIYGVPKPMPETAWALRTFRYAAHQCGPVTRDRRRSERRA